MFNGKDLTGWQGMIPTNEYGEGDPFLRYKLSAKQLAAAQAKAAKVMAENWVVANGNIVQRIPYPDNEYNTNATMMPTKYQDGTRDQQSNLYWALGGEGATQSSSRVPNNL